MACKQAIAMDEEEARAVRLVEARAAAAPPTAA